MRRKVEKTKLRTKSEQKFETQLVNEFAISTNKRKEIDGDTYKQALLSTYFITEFPRKCTYRKHDNIK